MSGSLAGYLLCRVAASLTYLKGIAVSGTGSGNYGFLVGVAVKRASFSRGKSGYGVVGEVVGLEGNVAVVVGCLDGLKRACIGNEPNGNTVYVLAICKGVGKSNGYPVVFTKAGNVFASVIDGEVIDGAIAYLIELVGGKTEIVASVALKLVSRNGNVLVTDGVDNTAVEADVRVVKLNFLICKIARIYLVGGGTNVNGNGLGGVTNGAGVGSFAVYNCAGGPVVTGGVCGNSLSVLVAASALVGLYAVCRAGCRGSDACYVIVLVYGFAVNGRAASAALALIYQNVFASAYVSFGGNYTGNVVTKLGADGFGVGIITVTLVGLGSRRGTGCILRCSEYVVVSGYVSLAANVTSVIVVGICIGAIVEKCATAVVTKVVVVACAISVLAHIVLTASVITYVIKVLVLVTCSSAGGDTTFRAGCGYAAGCVGINVGAYVSLAANVTSVVAVSCGVGAA